MSDDEDDFTDDDLLGLSPEEISKLAGLDAEELAALLKVSPSRPSIARSPIESLEARTRSGMLFPMTALNPGRPEMTASFLFQRLVKVNSIGAFGDPHVTILSIAVAKPRYVDGKLVETIVDELMVVPSVPIAVFSKANLYGDPHIPTLDLGVELRIRVGLSEPRPGAWAFVLETTESVR